MKAGEGIISPPANSSQEWAGTGSALPKRELWAPVQEPQTPGVGERKPHLPLPPALPTHPSPSEPPGILPLWWGFGSCCTNLTLHTQMPKSWPWVTACALALPLAGQAPRSCNTQHGAAPSQDLQQSQCSSGVAACFLHSITGSPAFNSGQPCTAQLRAHGAEHGWAPELYVHFSLPQPTSVSPRKNLDINKKKLTARTSQLMIKQGGLHNFPWNVCVDGCGTLTGWNGKNSLTAGTGWGPGDAAATARLGRRWMGCPSPPVSVSAPRSRDLGHRAGGDQPQQVVGVLPPQGAGKYSTAICFIQLVCLQAWVSAKQMQTSCLSVLIYEFKSTQHTYKWAVSPGLTYKCQTKIHQDWWVGGFLQHSAHLTLYWTFRSPARTRAKKYLK